MTAFLRLEAFRATPLVNEPFEYLVVPGFVTEAGIASINADYPKIGAPGSFPVHQLAFGPGFRQLLDELESDSFREAFEEKFAIGLSGRQPITAVRGWCGLDDGDIHPDASNKMITALIYTNERWDADTGRLRLLRSAHDLDDVLVEVPPLAGTLVAFRPAHNSWHGHRRFAGERRVIQFNWLTTSRRVIDRPALIEAGGTGDTRNCIVVDVSETGARIRLDGPAAIPREFMLLIPPDGGGHRAERRACCVVWRANGQVGVRFLSSQQS